MAFRGTGMVPFGGAGSMFGLRREIDRLFEDAFGGGGRSAAPTWAPAVDVREDNQEITLNVELPGIKPEEVEISVDNGVLTLRGEKSHERKEGEEGRYHLVERTYGSFTRSFVLPQGLNEEQISADFDNGLLMIRIPKAALPQPRRIQIGAGQQVAGGQQQAAGGQQGGREAVSGGASGRSRSQGSGQQTGGRMAASESGSTGQK